MKQSRKNKRYELCFFSLIGIVIAAVMYVFHKACYHFGLGQPCFALIGAVVPVLMSGGVPLAGFMNTLEVLSLDALSSKQPEEKKTESVGNRRGSSFAAIAMAAYFLLYASGLVVVWKERQLLLLGFGYVISRTLYGMAFVWFPEAAGQKSPYSVISGKQKQMLRVILSVILALCFCTCMAISPIMGMLEALICMWIWTYDYYMSKKRFGGVTEDASGYCLTLCELAVVLFVGLFGKVLL